MSGLWPVFAARDERFRAACNLRWGVEPGHIRTVATYAEQKDLYDRWRLPTSDPRHFSAPTVANPDAAGYLAPFQLGGWRQHGSWHQEQPEDPDHYGYAIDYQWPANVPIEKAHALAAEHGIRFPLPSENWHGQPFDWNGLYTDLHEHDEPVASATAIPTEDEDVSLTIHFPTIRGDDHSTWDFQYLPANGSTVGPRAASVFITIRQSPNTGHNVTATVYCDGTPAQVGVGGDGRTVAVPVTAAGLCSVVGPGLSVQAREFWS